MSAARFFICSRGLVRSISTDTQPPGSCWAAANRSRSALTSRRASARADFALELVAVA